MGIYEELEWRGLIKDCSSPELREKLNAGGMTFYIGTDPTGDSLHIGHFSSFLITERLKRAGHHPILLVGGGTGLIGDPKPDSERPMITHEQVNHNFESLKKQTQELFGFEVVNNYDWYKDMNFIDYLRDFGKYFNINYMLGKDIIARRLDSGITYTEFSYMIMQALDFWWLNENKNVTLQVAGQDQWGNITAGIDLIRKKTGKECYGLTMPLLTKSDGQKFGKTNGKAVWLDAKKTSPYEMYQFFVNSEDEKVIDYLKFLTFLSKEEIESLEEKHKTQPHLREAHKALAKEVITYIHGEEAYLSATKIASVLFGGDIRELSFEQIKDAASGMENFSIEEGVTLCDAIVAGGIAKSKREAREWIQQGSIQVNGVKVNDPNTALTKDNSFNGELVVLKKGKRNWYVCNFK